jgi:hypothetical protein
MVKSNQQSKAVVTRGNDLQYDDFFEFQAYIEACHRLTSNVAIHSPRMRVSRVNDRIGMRIPGLALEPYLTRGAYIELLAYCGQTDVKVIDALSVDDAVTAINQLIEWKHEREPPSRQGGNDILHPSIQYVRDKPNGFMTSIMGKPRRSLFDMRICSIVEKFIPSFEFRGSWCEEGTGAWLYRPDLEGRYGIVPGVFLQNAKNPRRRCLVPIVRSNKFLLFKGGERIPTETSGRFKDDRGSRLYALKLLEGLEFQDSMDSENELVTNLRLSRRLDEVLNMWRDSSWVERTCASHLIAIKIKKLINENT